MKRSEESHHLNKWVNQLGLLHDATEFNDHLLNAVERLREIAISTLEPITPPGADLRDFDYVPVFCSKMKEKTENDRYVDALNLLRMCTYYLKRGEVGQSDMQEIIRLYAESNKAEETKEVIHEEGQKTGKPGGDQSGKVRHQIAKQKWALWQAEADKIWEKTKNSKLSKSSVAELIAKKIGGDPGTIRKKLKKPLP